MEIVVGIFALIGFVIVVFFVVSKLRRGSPLEQKWRQIFAHVDLAAENIFARRTKPHSNKWHLDYDREFFRAVSGLCGEGAAKQLRDEGITALPMLFHLLSHIPDDLLEAFWRRARETADKAVPEDSGGAVLWDLVWLILSGEQLGRIAQNEGQVSLAGELKLRAASVLVPGSLKVDNRLADQ